ncbi:MAG: translation initiation factor IF-3 [Candidatus Hydrogenedentes bacterium]|nr:translation initiation factor IF-3 [Candidatus Hydrogenedentota bacterium]
MPISKQNADRVRVNEMIRARQVRVIDDDGTQLGIMRPDDALRAAEERGLDLVEVAGTASPPVCRIMDFGKFKYQQSKRARESKKHQHTIVIKEVKYRPKIDDHDFDFKTNHVREFLQEGNKVKITIMFRGREMAHPEFGQELLTRVVEGTKDLAQAEPDPRHVRMEGRNMVLMLSPLR